MGIHLSTTSTLHTELRIEITMSQTFWMAVFVAVMCLAVSQAAPAAEAKIIDNVPEKLGNLLNSVLEFKGQVLNVVLSPFHYVAGTLLIRTQRLTSCRSCSSPSSSQFLNESL